MPGELASLLGVSMSSARQCHIKPTAPASPGCKSMDCDDEAPLAVGLTGYWMM